MAVYLATLLGITLIALASGCFAGRRRQPGGGRLSSLTAGLLIGGGICWFLAAQAARRYADTDGFGAGFAEGFAHSGKWFVLLAVLMFGHGWVCGTHQTPPDTIRRTLYHLAVWGMTTLAVARTLPVYIWLDAGRRDENHCLRQSEKIEVTCGAVALLNYLERYRHFPPLTEREVSRICGVTLEGTTTAALVSAARHFGLPHATARVLTLAELENTRLPVIVSISTLPTVHHATLLIRLETDRACFLDPTYGFWEVPRGRFKDIWYGKTVLLEE